MAAEVIKGIMALFTPNHHLRQSTSLSSYLGWLWICIRAKDHQNHEWVLVCQRIFSEVELTLCLAEIMAEWEKSYLENGLQGEYCVGWIMSNANPTEMWACGSSLPFYSRLVEHYQCTHVWWWDMLPMHSQVPQSKDPGTFQQSVFSVLCGSMNPMG